MQVDSFIAQIDGSYELCLSERAARYEIMEDGGLSNIGVSNDDDFVVNFVAMAHISI